MAALEEITTSNQNKYNGANDEKSFPVKAGFWNALITLLKTVINEDGELLVDTVSEQTSGEGVTLDGVKLIDNDVEADEVRIDSLIENTTDSGVLVEGVLIKDSKCGDTLAYTANSTGGNTAIMRASQHTAVITATDANHIVSLPELADVVTGTQINGVLVNTGCELRVHPDDQTGTVYINGVTGGNELQLNSGTAAYFEAVKYSATKWIVKTWSSLGAPTTIVPDA